jgi:hypothetical protein
MTPWPTIFAQVQSTTRFGAARTELFSEGWQWLLVGLVCVVVIGFVVWMYRRDSRELPLGVAFTLTGLRLFAFAGLFVAFLNFEKRTEREVVQNSRVVLLVDASQSMSLEDADDTSGSTSTSSQRRIDTAVRELGTFLADLRKRHDVVVMRFDESEQPVELASYTRVATDESQLSAEQSVDSTSALTQQLASVRVLMSGAAALVALALVGIVSYIFSGQQTSIWPSLRLTIGVICLVAGVLLAAGTNLTYTDLTWASIVGSESVESLHQRIVAQNIEDSPKLQSPREVDIDWAEKLTPAGSETRLGEALMAVLNRQRGGPVAGVILVSDGRSNAGLPYTDAITIAQESDIRLYAVGMGSSRQPTNAALVDMEAPSRIYPGDAFTITGYVQAFGLDDRPAKVELVSYPYGQAEEQRETRSEDERSIRLTSGGQLMPVKFDIKPSDEAGRRVYELVLKSPSGDTNPRDNARQATVEIVERRTKVLLLAGGPSREYQFLRNQLYRDSETIAHVLLQTGEPGVSQEANDFDDGTPGIWLQFPETADELFQYDAIVAFDPDWSALSDEQISLLEEWVSKHAGGLIVIAGPVHTPQWASQRRGAFGVDTLKGMYPVVFYNRGTSVGLGRFGAEEPSRLEFTREGLESEFLWLGENASESQHAWSGFEGVYGYYAVKDIKPGATIYAKFVNEKEAVGDDMPVYMAGHFYGAGRVFFLASGEMWRIRQIDDTYFDTYYTKLIRHVAEGRLLRDSPRGVLLVERTRYKIGDAVNVQARLNDAQLRPLSASDMPEVSAIVIQPGGSNLTVKLRNVNTGGETLAGREGLYAGQFTALAIGEYNIQLTVPGTGGEQVLSQPLSVRAPRKEIENPQRNDALLVDLAERTGGLYYVGMPAAVGHGQEPSLASRIEPRDRLTPLPDLPDKRFDEQLAGWLIGLVAGALCLEWLIRRVSKLA